MPTNTTLTNHLYIGNYNNQKDLVPETTQKTQNGTNENHFWGIKCDQLITVQHYSFHMERSRNEAGMPYGPVLTTIMEFSVRFNGDGGKDFYTYMHDNSAQVFTFFWSPEFFSDPSLKFNGCLKSFGGVMLVSGHIVDVDETLVLPTNTQYKQLELNVKLLVSDISFGDKDGGNTCDLSLKQESSATVKGYSKYALFITDNDAPEVGVEGGITHSVSQQFEYYDNNKKKEVRAILKNLWYHKRISQPCEITANITLTWDSTQSEVIKMPSRDDIKKMFFHKRVQLKIVDSERKLDQLIANNYFVYELNPCYKRTANTSSVDVELHMFSLDKLMTLDRFSVAYTAKRLGNDIFSGKIGDFKLFSTDSDFIMPLSCDFDNMQVLKISTDDKELRIPYCVQYNETFYEFIKRLANRYGEFLYFEDGKLHLGLEPGISNYNKNATNGGFGFAKAINWAEVKELQARSYQHFNAKYLNVKDQHSDYLKRTDNTIEVYSSDNFINPDPVPADENLKTLDKEGGKSMADQYAEWRKYLTQDMLAILSGNSLAQFIADFMFAEAFRAIKAKIKADKSKKNFMADHYTPYKDDSKKKYYPGHVSDEEVMQFGTIAGKKDLETNLNSKGLGNLTSVFFSVLREMEREVAEEAVTLNFGEFTQPFSLGDKIQVDGIDYIIIDIEGQADKSEDGFIDMQQVTAIPLFTRTKNGTTSFAVIPPLLPDIQICEAKPQRAFIAATNDPLELGRVRIRYPWQKKEDDASPWIRVTLPMATDGGCVNFSPSEGDEAMIDYENGNIERPYVTGYVMSPYTKFQWGGPSVPDKGIVSAHGHSLTFDDGSDDGANFFWGCIPTLETAHALFPFASWLENKSPGMQGLVGGFTLTDRYGLYKVSGSSDGRKVEISSPMGDVSLSAFTGIKISAPNGDIKISGKNVTICAGDKLTLKSGENIKRNYINTSKKFGWNEGKWFGAELALGLLNNISAKTLESCIDFSFLRCVLDVFARPVDGTLKIKSNTHVMVEAGKGSVQIPRSFYNNAPSDIMTDEEHNEQAVVMPVVFKTMEVIETEVNAFVDNFRIAFDTYNNAYKAYKAILTRQNDPDGHVLLFNKIKEKAWEPAALHLDISNVTLVEQDLVANAQEYKKLPPDLRDEPDDPDKMDDFDTKKATEQTRIREDHNRWLEEQRIHRQMTDEHDEMVRTYTSEGKKMIDAIYNLRNACDTESSRQLTAFNANTMVKGIADQLRGFFELVKCPIKMNMVANEANFPDNITTFNDWDAEKKYIKRKIVYKMITDDGATYTYTPPSIKGVAQAPKTLKIKEVIKVRPGAPVVTDFTDDAQWSAFIKEVLAADKSSGDYIKEWLKEHYGQQYLDLIDVFYRNKTWNPKAKGRILFSDTPSKTISFSQSGINTGNNTDVLTTPIGPEISRILGDLL